VNFDTGRVRPRLSLDASAGVRLTQSAPRLRLQVDVRNLTNRLDVINFAGLFSGTALAPPAASPCACARSSERIRGGIHSSQTLVSNTEARRLGDARSRPSPGYRTPVTALRAAMDREALQSQAQQVIDIGL
jgi:hypothetical protein